MAGPWEKYQSAPAADGPWAKYGQPAPQAERPAANDGSLAGLITGKKKQRTATEDLGHQFSYQGREFLNGVGGLAGLLVDPVAAGMEKLGLPHGYRGRELSGMAADALHLDRPETGTERLYGDVQNALGGTAASFGLGALASNGGRVAQGVSRVLTDRPGLQVASAATGAGAGGLVRENGGGAGAQFAASLAGSLAPGVKPAAAASLRGLLRGGEAGRQNVLDMIDTFRSAGTTPTVGQATQGRMARATESMLAATPGSAGVMARKAEQQATEVGARASGIADRLSPGADPVQAGLAIRRGIASDAADSFRSRTGAKSGELYGAFDAQMPPGVEVPVTNTLTRLRAQTASIPGAPNVSQRLRNGELSNILDAFEQDATRPSMYPGVPSTPQIPYAGLKATRTEIGHKMGDAAFGDTSIPRRQLSDVYGGMSDDMRAAAQGQGPQAERAFDRANRYFRATQGRNDAIADVVNADAPEKIYRAATAGTEGGATQLTALMKSLPKEAQQTVAATVIKRLGRATNGMQNEAGDAFSSQTFLTNWSKLSPQAKTALFARLPAEMQKEIGAIAKVGANVRDGSKVFGNPSGSGSKVLQLLGASGIGGAVATGNVPGALGILAGAGAANGAARVMTSPAVVNALGRRTRVPAYLLPGLANGSATK